MINFLRVNDSCLVLCLSFDNSYDCLYIVDVRLLDKNEKWRIFYTRENKEMCISNLLIASRVLFLFLLFYLFFL